MTNSQVFLLSLVGNVHPSCKPLLLDGFFVAPPRLLNPRVQAGGGTEEVVVQYPEHPALGPIIVGPQAPNVSPEAVAAAAAAIAAEAAQAGAESGEAGGGAGGGGSDRALGYRAIKASWIYPKEGEDMRFRAALQRAALEGIRFVEKVAANMAGGRSAMVGIWRRGTFVRDEAELVRHQDLHVCNSLGAVSYCTRG